MLRPAIAETLLCKSGWVGPPHHVHIEVHSTQSARVSQEADITDLRSRSLLERSRINQQEKTKIEQVYFLLY